MEVILVGVSVSLGDRHSPIPKGGYGHLFIRQDGETPTMCHHTLLHGNFHVFLLRIDEDLAAKTQADGCRRCGEVLHKNRYQRKPRGGGLINLGQGPHFCLSLTCKTCGKRHNPPSVRFLGSRVYVAATVVLASALRFGLTDARMARLSEWLRVPERTIARWRHWWLKDFVESLFWKNARARFMPPVVHAALPASLLEQFKDPDFPSQLVALLHFLTALSEGG